MSSEILDSMVDVPPDRVVGRILVISKNMKKSYSNRKYTLSRYYGKCNDTKDFLATLPCLA